MGFLSIQLTSAFYYGLAVLTALTIKENPGLPLKEYFQFRGIF